MTPHQLLESEALEMIQVVLAGGRIEDDRVEAKSDWPDPDATKTAWQLGGLANSAIGDPIVWLVGVDEDDHRVAESVDAVEPTDWWYKVKARFDGVPPELIGHIRVPTPSGGTVWALKFSTDQGPYVVKRGEDVGRLDRGLPWRESGSTVAATQFQVHRSIRPIGLSPTTYPILAQVHLSVHRDSGAIYVKCQSEARLAVTTQSRFGATLLLEEQSQVRTTLFAGPPNDPTEILTIEAQPEFEVLAGSTDFSAIGGGGLSLNGVGLIHLKSAGMSEAMAPYVSGEDIPDLTTAARIELTLDGPGLLRPLQHQLLVDDVSESQPPQRKKLIWTRPSRTTRQG